MKKLLACFVFMIGVQEASATRAICERLIHDEQKGLTAEETDGVKVKIRYDEKLLAISNDEGFPEVFHRIPEEFNVYPAELNHYTYGRFDNWGRTNYMADIDIYILHSPHKDCRFGHTMLRHIWNLHLAPTEFYTYKCGCP